MKMMFRLVTDRQIQWRLRFLAFLNLTGCLYFFVMSLSAAYLVWCTILPYFYTDRKLVLTLHKTLVLYVSVNAFGNFFLCMFVNNGVRHSESDTGESGLNRKLRKRGLCGDCEAVKPNRSHHCPLCRTCILKRDHHCFFMTVCIGYYNQKHFIFYCLFMFVGTFYTLIMVVKYANALYGLRFSGPQTFVTLLLDTVVDCVSERPPSFFYLYLILMIYSSLVMGLVSVVFFYWQITIATSGQTTFEAWRGVGTYSQNPVTHNLRDVFGKCWPLLIFLPLPLPQYGDGTYPRPVSKKSS